MSEEQKVNAQKLVKGLRTLLHEQYNEHLSKCMEQEAHIVMQQAKQYGFKQAYSLPMTREDFDEYYAALEQAGVKDPQAYMKNEASFIRELHNNDDPIGRDFMAAVKLERIKMAPLVAKKLGVSDKECETILSEFGDLTRSPGADLTDAEKNYIEALRLPIAYSMKNEVYTSNAYDRLESPWAKRIRDEDQSKAGYRSVN